MPWKEPGEKPREPSQPRQPRQPREPREPRNRNPWGQGNHGGGGPDFDAWLRKLRGALGPFGHGPFGIPALIVLVIVLWFLIGGWVVVGNQQVGVVLRLGRLEAVLQPGFHLRLPSPIDRVQIVDMGRTRTVSDEVRLLTGDGQLALVDYYVQYKLTDARQFLFGIRNAQDALRNAATVAVRAVVGTRTLQQLMDRGNGKLAADLKTHLVAALAGTDTGTRITGVGIQNIGVPSEAQSAFDAISKAHENAKAAQAAATAAVARDKVGTKAQAAAMIDAAGAYRTHTVAEARAGAARFGQILAQYQAAPQVTRHQLWLEAMHAVLSKNHVVVNTGTGNVIVQFPVTRHAAASAPAAAASTGTPASAASVPAPAASSALPVTSGPTLRGVGA